MKVKIVLITLMIFGLIGTGSMAIAGEKNTKKNVVTETGIKVASGIQETAVFTGNVEKTDLGIVLVGEKETYILEGDGLEELLGKKVEITGTLIKGNTVNTIIVVKAEFAKI